MPTTRNSSTTIDAEEGRLPEVAIISPSGWGNLGDSAIVESVIRAVRRRMPERSLAAFTLNPVDTAERHHVPAFTCAAFQLPHYSVTEDVPFASPATLVEPSAPAPDGKATFPPGLRRFARAVPGLRGLRAGVRSVKRDFDHQTWLREPTSRVRLVVVAGGGQLDDFWGGAFGHPYVLWRWARRARALGSRYVVLSVGTGSLKTAMSRYFVQQALASADYRSFRDEGSRSLVRDPRVDRDPVVPDLAYGLPIEDFRVEPGEKSGRPVVAISPIAYCDPRNWPIADEGKFRSYLRRLAVLVARLLESDHDVLLYGTDGPDIACIADLREEVRRHVSAELLGRIRAPQVRTHEDLFAALAGVDAVVAARLHGVILAHLLSIPTLALSYERKVATVMGLMRHEHFCLPIETFEPAEAEGRIREILQRRSELSSDVAAKVAGFRRLVDAQYDQVFLPEGARDAGR